MNLESEQRNLLIRELVGSRDVTRPNKPVPLAVPPKVDTTPLDLAVSWYGHSTALVEVDGYRVLTDPIWSRRCSPSRTVGPERMHEVPVLLEALPALDAVIISHDHYDHLDMDTDRRRSPTANGRRSSSRSVSAHICGSGASPSTASSNSTGTRATRSGS